MSETLTPGEHMRCVNYWRKKHLDSLKQIRLLSFFTPHQKYIRSNVRYYKMRAERENELYHKSLNALSPTPSQEG